MKKNKTNDFTMYVPNMIAMLGGVVSIMCMILMIGFSIASEELPHYLCYVILGSFLLLGAYAIILAYKWKVIVKGTQITVYPIFLKPYSFEFKDIVSVRRQVKNNRVKSERVVIKTSSGKKLIVERAHTSYSIFVSRLLEETDCKIQSGF